MAEYSEVGPPRCESCGDPLVESSDIEEGLHFFCDPDGEWDGGDELDEGGGKWLLRYLSYSKYVGHSVPFTEESVQTIRNTIFGASLLSAA